MSHPRISLARDAQSLALPGEGDIFVFGAAKPSDLAELPADRVVVVSPFKTDHIACKHAGLRVCVAPPGRAVRSVVFLPRSKQLARGLIARAVAVTDGAVAVDGQKTDGIDSVLKDCRKRARIGEVFAKAHGKLFIMDAEPDGFADWLLPDAPLSIGEGLVTRPGVFSADGIDPASRLLADSLPKVLGKRLADLGAGWGYLSRCVLQRADIAEMHLVEDDHIALDCARENVTDPRAVFHWADATAWRPDHPLDGIVMNPPFHSGRAADPGLGQAFIANAAGCLGPHGRLWLVANRHLPYEATLALHFREVQEIAGDNRFKVLAAYRPTRHRK